jgi:hypothetical protein
MMVETKRAVCKKAHNSGQKKALHTTVIHASEPSAFYDNRTVI